VNNKEPASPEIAPALALWVQLATRITTLPLHYRSGHEESAAVNVFDLFPLVRKLVTEHPEAAEFRKIAVELLNNKVRSYSDRWHGWMNEVKNSQELDGRPTLRFQNELVRQIFRQELKDLQAHLIEAKLKLATLAKIELPKSPDERPASLGAPLRSGINGQVAIETNGGPGRKLASIDDLNREEGKVILGRRCRFDRLRSGDLPRSLSDLEPKGPASGPSPEFAVYDTVGLALSGGGIRSATFCLGITQTLVRKGLFLDFDYLSTVSGGGYFGGFLSCSLGTIAKDGEGNSIVSGARSKAEAMARIDEVFHRQAGTTGQAEVESGLLRQLRNNSKYLLSGGFIGRMKALCVLCSGVLWNVLMALPLPLAAALLTMWAGPWLWGSDSSALTFPPLLLGSPIGWALSATALILALSWLALPGIQKLTHGKPPKSGPALFRNAWEMGTLYIGFLTTAVGSVYLLPTLFMGHEWVQNQLKNLPLDGAWSTSADFAPASIVGIASAAIAALARFLGPNWPRVRALAVRLFILSGPLFFLLIYLSVGSRLGVNHDGVARMDWKWVLGVAVALGLWSAFFVNINTLAPHLYYRNRICECYLVRRLKRPDKTRFSQVIQKVAREPVQVSVEVLNQVPLSGLGADAAAPYHLINMTLNVPSSGNKNLRGRASDFFTASKCFCGSPMTGYLPTAQLEQSDPHFDLGTAIAVSGAAASTSMGVKTLPHYRFLMTLLNVRLGYWLPNPRRPAMNWLLQGAGVWYLFREMFGRMNEQCRYINLSDGGHIENLAVYELLRRRCKYIVCVDGGQEAGMECADLVRLQRYAEIDLGIRMHFDPSDLTVGSDGYSRAHAILVKLDYKPDVDDHASSNQLGWMLYLKLAMTGAESTSIRDYKRVHPDFPHESTGDQIYEEEQFEAYRELGKCAMEGLFRPQLVGLTTPATVADWFQCLANNLLPDNDPVFRPAANNGAADPR